MTPAKIPKAKNGKQGPRETQLKNLASERRYIGSFFEKFIFIVNFGLNLPQIIRFCLSLINRSDLVIFLFTTLLINEYVRMSN